ncbi:MAG: CAP domain-containing protein, partial [Chloroflexota bacterium]
MMASTSPRSVLGRASFLAISSLLGAALLLSASPQVAIGWNQGAAEGTLWQLLNGARTNNGLAPLQSHGTLISLARWRSSDMIQRNYFSHDIAGTGCQIYCYFDSNGLAYTLGGENIAWNNGQPDDYSPVAAHEGFMNSPGHRANILSPAWTHGGVGAAAADNVNFLGSMRSPRLYTELFIQAAGAPAPPPSGGGGSAPAPSYGGGSAPASSGQAPAAAASQEPKEREYAVDAPERPAASAAMDGSELIVAAAPSISSAAVRAMAWSDPGIHDASPPTPEVAGEYRVQAAAPA